MNYTTGVVASPPMLRSYEYEVVRGNTQDVSKLPETYMLPEEYIPPVRDQGMIGMCVQMALCGCAESHFLMHGDSTRRAPGYGYGRIECRGEHRDSGLYPDYAINGMTKIGFVPFRLYPILKEVPEAIELASERDDLLEVGKMAKPSGYTSLAYAMEDKTWNNIRTALAVENSALIIVSHDHFNGGSHAVMGVGYTNKSGKHNGRYVVFQNSWGENWSVDGRSEIPVNRIDEAYMLVWDDIKIPFEDVLETDWFYDDVRSVYLSGLVSGTSDTTFEPNGDFIRGDVAIILSRMLDKFEYSINAFAKSKRQLGIKVSNISFAKPGDCRVFTDVNPTDYYCDAIHKVFVNGLMTGVNAAEFNPKGIMTRAEAATIIVRTLNKLKSLLEKAIPAPYMIAKKKVDLFSDVDSSAWYSGYINEACAIGLMNGNGDGTFSPDKGIVRCEGAAIFHRLFKAVENLMMQAI